MEDLNKEYMLLFNGITDTIQYLEKTIARLRRLQQRAEEEYLQNAENINGDLPVSRPDGSLAAGDDRVAQ